MIFAACIAGGVLACGQAERLDVGVLASRSFALADGTSRDWSALRGTQATVIITLDPECPFCQGSAPLLDSLADAYTGNGVRFVGLYPAGFIAADSVVKFAAAVGFDFPQVMDDDCSIANIMHARVTPEVFVLDTTNTILYHGAIDDWAVRAGRHKVRATEHYLVKALDALLDGSAMPASVPAVGCIVECDVNDNG